MKISAVIRKSERSYLEADLQFLFYYQVIINLCIQTIYSFITKNNKKVRQINGSKFAHIQKIVSVFQSFPLFWFFFSNQ